MAGTNSFDQNVDRYEAWFIDHPLAYVSELRAIRELLPNGSGVEIGVGTGRFAAPLGITRGVEPSRPMAELARKKGIEVAAGVAEHLPYSDGEFDYALMATTVCFLDDIETAFREVHRVLRPGGSFLIGFVDRDSSLGREYLERKDKSVFYRDATFYSVSDIITQLEKAGFRDHRFRQTLFRPPADLTETEPVRPGHGEGSFVVVQALKST
ncbi:MAG: methyltransferase domain-containing protein [Nitrospirota bacterium]|nr:methyltransferase domain-containing protein [Nitrospirota bacterium]